MHQSIVFSKFCILLVKVQVFIFQFFVLAFSCYNVERLLDVLLCSVSRCTTSLWGYVACYLIRNRLVAYYNPYP